jgi:hypothetical protein
VQNEPITAAVQLAPHVCAAATVINLIAVADVETGLGTVPPNRVLDEPGKHLGKRWIEPAGINPRGNAEKDVRAPTWPVAGRSIRMASPEPIQDSGSMKEVVDQSIDDNETSPNGEPPRAGCPSPHQQGRQCHADDLVGDAVDVAKGIDQGGSGRCKVGGFGIVS